MEERDARGRFLTVPKGAAPPITSDNAREMVKKRVEKYRRAAIKRITGEIASIDPDVTTSADAFGVIASKQALALMDSEKPRMADLEKLRNLMTGEDGSDSRRSHEPVPPNSVTFGSPDALVELVNMIERQQRQKLDAERAVDGTESEAE